MQYVSICELMFGLISGPMGRVLDGRTMTKTTAGGQIKCFLARSNLYLPNLYSY